jgi:hypothetical protein
MSCGLLDVLVSGGDSGASDWHQAQETFPRVDAE